VSLSTWFRDYLYIPLGGSRCSKARAAFNTMVTFLLSGLWHGASWHFVAWGALHGAYQIIGSWAEPLKKKFHGPVYMLWCRLRTFALCVFAWLLFRADSMSQVLLALRRFCIFDLWSLSGGRLFELGLDKPDMIVALASLLVLFAVDLAGRRCEVGDLVEKQVLPVRWLVYLLGVFAIIVFGIYGPQYEAAAFIYFQF
jgi:D-alanyl-lipoteichoic acid acyltransferase DltB (MBOAT superfamily)